MNTVLIIAACLLAAVGLAGSIIPGLPGPPLSWAALLVLYFTTQSELTWLFLVITAVVAAIITVCDYIIPAMSTKRFGGSKAGVWGCNIGLVLAIIGLPFGPEGVLGIVFWPFVGALVGELINKKPFGVAAKAALGSFIGFVSGTLLKLTYGIFAVVVIVQQLVQ